MEFNKSKEKLISIEKLRAGDILLCHSDTKTDDVQARKIQNKITIATKSRYTHAAICINSFTVAEMTNRVEKTAIQELLTQYPHIAVFRQHDAWRLPEQVQALNNFIDSVIDKGVKYNIEDVKLFSTNKKNHAENLSDHLHCFFKSGDQPLFMVNGEYFCSEFVAACFIASGFIDASAAIVENPKVISPSDLGNKPTFGTFYGYISHKVNYEITEDDEFATMTTYSEIFESE